MDRTADEVANEAIMSRKETESLILLVEGYNDEKTFRKFLASDDSEIISSWGKQNVIVAIDILETEGLVGFLGIVDADFWHIDGHPPISPNIIITDDHDLEMMMIRSASFSHFINEVAAKTKMQNFLIENDTADLRDIMINIALPIGCLRRYSSIHCLNLDFNNIKFSTFIHRENLALNIEKMVEVVLSNTRNSSLNLDETVREIYTMVGNVLEDPYQICCGHDVIAILSIGLRKKIGSRNQNTASCEILESELRMSYDSDCFRQTQLYKSSEEWSDNNPPFRVFN